MRLVADSQQQAAETVPELLITHAPMHEHVTRLVVDVEIRHSVQMGLWVVIGYDILKSWDQGHGRKNQTNDLEILQIKK